MDEGAKKALREKGKSLLPPGITKCEGQFSAGDVVRICDRALFKEQCEKAPQHPGIQSALVVLGSAAEERCPEGARSCEAEIPGGPGPLFDGCIVEYEKETGKVLKSRWYGF